MLNKILGLLSMNLFFFITFIISVFLTEFGTISVFYGLFIFLFNYLFFAYTMELHSTVRKAGIVTTGAICFLIVVSFTFFQFIDGIGNSGIDGDSFAEAWDSLEEIHSDYIINRDNYAFVSLQKKKGNLQPSDVKKIVEHMPDNGKEYEIMLESDDYMQYVNFQIDPAKDIISCNESYEVKVCDSLDSADFEQSPLNEQLKSAILADDYQQVVSLIEQGADPNYIDSNGMPMTQYSTVRDNNQISIYLFEQGADLNAQDESGKFTSLILGAIHGNNELVSYLVARGADKELTSFSGETAYEAAIRMKQTDTAQLLK